MWNESYFKCSEEGLEGKIPTIWTFQTFENAMQKFTTALIQVLEGNQ